MARKSKLARNDQRRVLIERQAERRTELRAVINDPNATLDEKQVAYGRFNKMPRDGSPTRYVNRCGVTGRPRAFMRKFGVSRIVFRELANQGLLPGVKKSSW
jgi:small subunit ribosomal protein S14